MDFAAFLLLNTLLFIRPGEIFPPLLGVPLYDPLLLVCSLVSLSRVTRQLNFASLARRPITVCVTGVIAAAVLSHLVRFSLFGARTYLEQLSRVFLYYLTLVAVVNTPARLRQYLTAIVVLILAVASLAIAQFHGLIEIEALTVLTQKEYAPDSDEAVELLRLRGTGIFNDPNDLSQIITFGILICVGVVSNRGSVVRRLAHIVPLIAFGYALVLTQSRGGLLALMAGLLVLFWARFGTFRTVLLGALALPALFFLAGGRQASISTDESTGQERIQLWREGLLMFRESPVFGVGAGEFAERAGLVAHNSFVHCFAELGLLGGTAFLGAFAVAVWSLRRARPRFGSEPELLRLWPVMLAGVVAYAIGLLSLSRPYVVTPYILLGLATAYSRISAPVATGRPLLATPPLLARLAGLGIAFLIGIELFVRTFAH